MAAPKDAENITNAINNFHTLNEVKFKNNLSDIHSIFSSIDELRRQIYFMSITLKNTWTKSEFITVGIGTLAIIIGAITFDGELQEGGDFLQVGISPLGTGLSAVSAASFFQLILSMVFWVYFMYRLWNQYPVMRGQSVSLIIMWFSITLLTIGLHQGAPTFPLEVSSDGITIIIGALISAIFLGFVFSKAVLETRDLHVEEKHQNRDPRIMAESMYNHSLFGWVGILIIWSIIAFISSWAGAHYVAVRPHSSWFWQFTYILFGAMSISGMCMLLWYPQLMLGSGEITIKSKRAREVEDMQLGVETWKDEQGKCPECKAPSLIFRGKDGLPRLKCIKENCDGEGALNAECSLCKSKIPSRINCSNCGVSTPALKHLNDNEAW